ncbi:MAG: hypothetical protein K2X46_07555 [Roseomonas sp.]|nr:hypothetical protein [Roseomonas sp.]
MPRLTRRALIATAALPLAVPALGPALAQEGFPNRSIRIVVGFTPGGATDIAVVTRHTDWECRD